MRRALIEQKKLKKMKFISWSRREARAKDRIEKKKIDKFMKWCTQEGIELHPNVGVAVLNGLEFVQICAMVPARYLWNRSQGVPAVGWVWLPRMTSLRGSVWPSSLEVPCCRVLPAPLLIKFSRIRN